MTRRGVVVGIVMSARHSTSATVALQRRGPRLAGLHQRQGRAKPLAPRGTKMAHDTPKVPLVLVTRRPLGLVEQLDLGREVRQAVVCPAPDARQGLAKARFPPVHPVIAV